MFKLSVLRKLLLVSLIVMVALAAVSVAAQENATPRGGTIITSTGEQLTPRNFNPYSPDFSDYAENYVYERLFYYNPVEGGEITPWLATGYEYADDLMSVTFTLQDGVLWSDGEAFNADDVVFTFNMFLENPATDTAAVAEFLDSVEKVDDLTVKFNLNQVYTLAHEIISQRWMLPEHVWSAVEDPRLYIDENPVGTGPLTTIASYSEQSYELCRNENYWRTDENGEQLPYIDCIRQVLYQGNDPANLALINGELDWIGNFVPDIEETFVAVNPENHGYYFWPGGGTVQIYPNTSKAPFDDINFRRAMSMAIDYGAITDIAMFGYTSPSNAVGMGPRYDTWISEEALARADELGQTTYNPDAAAALLEESGYVDSDGDGIRNLPDGGENISFDVQVVNGWTDWVTSVQITSQGLQDVGLDATTQTPDFGAWLSNLQTGDYDVSIGWGTAGNTPYNYFRNLMLSDLIVEGTANAETWSRWTSEEADTLLNAFTSTADSEEQHAIVDQLQMLYVENMPAIPLFPGPTWYEYTTYRFTGFPTAEDYYAQGSPWDQNSRSIVINQIHCVDETSCGQ